jgi:hypothetical protein
LLILEILILTRFALRLFYGAHILNPRVHSVTVWLSFSFGMLRDKRREKKLHLGQLLSEDLVITVNRHLSLNGTLGRPCFYLLTLYHDKVVLNTHY